MCPLCVSRPLQFHRETTNFTLRFLNRFSRRSQRKQKFCQSIWLHSSSDAIHTTNSSAHRDARARGMNHKNVWFHFAIPRLLLIGNSFSLFAVCIRLSFASSSAPHRWPSTSCRRSAVLHHQMMHKNEVRHNGELKLVCCAVAHFQCAKELKIISNNYYYHCLPLEAASPRAGADVEERNRRFVLWFVRLIFVFCDFFSVCWLWLLIVKQIR